MIDIEDSFDIRPPLAANSRADGFFSIKVRNKKRPASNKEASPLNNNIQSSTIGWRHSVYLRTWGCSHNNSDSEYMAGLLTQAGYTLTSIKEDADLWLLNSCTVKTPSETLVHNQVEEAKRSNKRVVVAGCVSQAAPTEPWLNGISIVGVQQIDQIVSVVDETLNGNTVRLLSQKRKTPLSLNLPKVRRNAHIEIMAINSGCLNHCTYCKTKMARGDLKSFTLDDLVEHAKRAFVEDGCKEIWLTSEDLGAWGRDIGMALPDLLDALVEIIPSDCMMRLGMTNPPFILDYLEDIACILNHPRVYSFLHIPVQSGSDAVLSDMKREYTLEHFSRIVDYMRENVPGIYIATDFICAFPTETDEDHNESMALVEKYKFPSLFINQYYPRSGTPAARMKKIATTVARQRTAEMARLFHSYSRYTPDMIGSKHRVLICERASDGIHYVGHNKHYEHILVPSKDGQQLEGTWADVQIISVSKFYMKSELLIEVEERKGNMSYSITTISFALIVIAWSVWKLLNLFGGGI